MHHVQTKAVTSRIETYSYQMTTNEVDLIDNHKQVNRCVCLYDRSPVKFDDWLHSC